MDFKRLIFQNFKKRFQHLYCLYQKIINTAIRILHLFWFLPKRVVRVFEHLIFGLKNLRKPQSLPDFGFWLLELLALCLDVFGISEIYETWNDFLKWNTRGLNPAEKKIAQELFRGKLLENRIQLDDHAVFGPLQKPIVYVGFFTINSWGKFREDTFVHELVHIWQYQHFGAVYIIRALRAQKSRRAYDYGGIAFLEKLKARKKTLSFFNFEQQAEIVQDYYRLKNGLKTKRGEGNVSDLPVYEWFAKTLWQ